MMTAKRNLIRLQHKISKAYRYRTKIFGCSDNKRQTLLPICAEFDIRKNFKF
jgi:hypothetical protein